MLYSIHVGVEVSYRRRRNAAALLFERTVYNSLKQKALLDRPIAHKSMRRAAQAYKPDRDFIDIDIGEQTLIFHCSRL